MLETYEMVVATFSVGDKANLVRFFKKTFLMANISPDVILEIDFLTLSDADIDFLGRELQKRTYTTKKALPATRCVELVGKKEFAAAALDLKSETFIVYVTSLSSDVSASSFPLEINVYSFCRSQICSLIVEKALIKVSAKYSDITDVFSLDLASELPKHTGINDHAIELVDGQQQPYRPIYSLEPLELEILKAYIGTNLANGLIKPSKSPASTSILLNWKLNESLWLCINYWGLNNLTI